MKLSVVPGAWSAVAEYWLKQVDQAATVADLRVMAANGARVIYAVLDGSVVGAGLLRIDLSASGRPQGVIVAAAARVDEIDIIPSLLPAIEALFIGVESIRLHASRPGMVKKMAGLGYSLSELVLEKRVNHG